MPITTEQLLTVTLPELFVATPDRVPEAFREWNKQVAEAACPKMTTASNFDWSAAHKLIDANNQADGDPRGNQRVVDAASQTSVVVNGNEMRIHESLGVFLTLDESGRLIAGSSEPNPKVPEEYGSADPYVLEKLFGARCIEILMQQGADWGEGYAAWRRLRKTESPTIGMATMHEIPYGTVPAGTDRHAIAYTGASHRVATPAFARLMEARRPDSSVTSDSPDFMAGKLDTDSASVANRAAMLSRYSETVRRIVGNEALHIVTLPDPTDPDNIGVNWD